MNIKFLAWTSLLIAALFHLALFSLTTLVFQIDPAALKPKIFFLGPILSTSDVVQISPHNNLTPNIILKNTRLKRNHQKSMSPKIVDQTKNPFAIESIKKPLMPNYTLQKKTDIKSTFESSPQEDAEKTEIPERQDPDLKIQSYAPLKFHSPYND